MHELLRWVSSRITVYGIRQYTAMAISLTLSPKFYAYSSIGTVSTTLTKRILKNNNRNT